MYKTEATFSKAFVTKLRAHGGMAQRIESGLTSRGIPDIYWRTKTREYWIELKNTPKQELGQGVINVPWRPGQVAWMYKYSRVSKFKDCAYTIIALKAYYVVIKMSLIFHKNLVNTAGSTICTTLDEVIARLEWDSNV